MKYHKIRNVPLDVCTAEAKIAYNLAVTTYQDILKAYNLCTNAMQKSDIILEGVNFIIHCRVMHNENIIKKYNVDAIECCLRIGLEKYINEKHHILTSYEEIGKIFVSAYL